MTQSSDIWVYVEQQGGRAARVSLELLGKAAELAASPGLGVAAVIVGDSLDELAGELTRFADRVYLIEHPELLHYQNRAYAYTVAELLRAHAPAVFLAGATELGEELIPAIAARLGTGVTAHCIDLRFAPHEGKQLLFQTVPGWGGGKRIDIICPRHRPQVATVKPGVFSPPPAGTDRQGTVEVVPPQLPEALFRGRTVAVQLQPAGGIPLAEAEVIVAAGWGVQALGGIERLRELATLLGAAIGGTRPVVDKGYLPEEAMIGQSGKIVFPRLLIAIGASGATHFTTGFERAAFVLAVDKNQAAPIFMAADVGIVGDVREVLPALVEEVRKVKG